MTPGKFALAAALVVAAAWGQAARPAFEVASVKRSEGKAFPDFKPLRSGDRVTMHNVWLPTVVIYAYRLAAELATTSYQLEGSLKLPDGWDLCDFDALAPGNPSDDEIRLMFQNLLADRFHLRAHWEERKLTVYDLTLAKGGPKLRSGLVFHKVEPEPGVQHMRGRDLSIEQLVSSLAGRLEARVRNLTGLTGGAYDIDLAFARDANTVTANGTPDLPHALELELGLKLKTATAPVPVLAIDHVERPSEN